MITDYVKVYVKAGNGGNGCVSFHREKYVSHGGPDGGDGGHGGNIILVIETGDNTLLKYKYRHKFIAPNGGDGKTGKLHGANGDDIILPVPPGTVVKDAATGRVIIDMTERGPFILCKGGKGGWGNRHFATPTRQIPRFAKSGLKGEEKEVIFELKMLADVALIGLPSVGKSSLLSVISSATPKIADYDFTTLSPNLGVVKVGEGKGFVAADIPGLIEGASDGKGLGHKFLRHIDRCRLMLHVVDVSADCDRDPVADIRLINEELKRYSPELAERPQLIVANKYDASLPEYNEHVMDLQSYCDEQGLPLLFVSAATGYQVKEMIQSVSEMLKALPPLTIFEPEVIENELEIEADDETVEITKDGPVFVCESDWLWRLVGRVNFEDRDSLAYFQRMLRQNGIIDQLVAAGVKDGDTVRMYEFEFDFVT